MTTKAAEIMRRIMTDGAVFPSLGYLPRRKPCVSYRLALHRVMP